MVSIDSEKKLAESRGIEPHGLLHHIDCFPGSARHHRGILSKLLAEIFTSLYGFFVSALDRTVEVIAREAWMLPDILQILFR